MEAKVNIDDIVSYPTEYSSRLQKAKVQGDKLTALCPFHDDSNASFGVNLKNGKYKCFACGAEGNYVRFRAQLERISTKDAFKSICNEYNIELPKEEPQARQYHSRNAVSYTVSEYSLGKRLPKEWLEEYCKITQGKDRDGTGFIRIPYYNSSGELQVTRKRYSASTGQKFKWGYGSAGKLLLYGENHIIDYYDKGSAVFVEGESDTQTLWYMGFPALGVPGASNFKAEWVQKFGDIPAVYLHIEPDQGGETFYELMVRRLKQGEYNGRVFTFSCKRFGVKDPSELYIKYGLDKAREMLTKALKEANEINLHSAETHVSIEDAPIHLRNPEGWKYDEKGIFMQEPKSLLWQPVCRTPIILSQRLHSLDTGDEKIEIAFKRDDRWHTLVLPRATVFQSRSIVNLANMGCTVTSENARNVVKFLGALEGENMDILKMVESTSTCGWKTGNRFLPGCNDSIVIDAESTMRDKLQALSGSGSLADWVESMRNARENPFFRFMLAASFAAPLLKIVKVRNFTVYNWGDSKNGKTAALYAALSVWGNPERLTSSMNTTQVAIERLAWFFNDLPVGLDELQSANAKNRQEFVDKVIYMLGNGIGKARGAIEGMQETLRWRTIALCTGEEPIVNKNTMDGVMTRLIEFTGAPFTSSSAAANMYSSLSANYGTAGPEFIRWIMTMKEDSVQKLYESCKKSLDNYLKKINMPLDANKLSLVSVIMAADTLISKKFWDKEAELKECKKQAAWHIARVVKYMTSQDANTNTNTNAAEYISEWLGRKASCFASSPTDVLEWYGQIDEVIGKAYVLSTVLHDTLEKAGFNHRKTMKFLADKGMISVGSQGKMAILKKIGGRPIRMIEINIDKLVPEVEMAENAAEMGIEGVEIVDDTLPF